MKLRWLLVAALACALAGCASGGSVDAKDETLSLVYGYFDMKEAPTKLEWVSLKHYDGKEQGRYLLSAKDGLFLHIGIEPGSYQVDKFGGGGGFLSTPTEYSYGARGRNATAIRIQKPGVYFVGAHRYVNHPGGFFKADKFNMEPAKTPTEKELLQRVVKQLETDKELAPYTRQLQQARQRLSQL